MINFEGERCMKKRLSLMFGLCLLVFSGCSFEFNSGEDKVVWEYKQVTSYGEPIIKNFSSNLFDDITKELNELGKDGWELVGIHTVIETVFPNFGNEGYHTGIKTNTRTEKVVYTFKREVKEQKINK